MSWDISSPRGTQAESALILWNSCPPGFGLLRCHNIFRMLHHFKFFRIQLIHQSLGPQIEGTTRMLILGGSLTTVIKTPSGPAAFQGSAQILQKILRPGFPLCVAATEWLLLMHRHHAPNFLHELENVAGFRLGFTRRSLVPRPVGG